MKLHFIVLIGVLNVCWADFRRAKCVIKKGEWSTCTKTCNGTQSRKITTYKIGKDRPGIKLLCPGKRNEMETRRCSKSSCKFCKLYIVGYWSKCTGKFLSEALIFVSTNPPYDNRLFM